MMNNNPIEEMLLSQLKEYGFKITEKIFNYDLRLLKITFRSINQSHYFIIIIDKENCSLVSHVKEELSLETVDIIFKLMNFYNSKDERKKYNFNQE